MLLLGEQREIVAGLLEDSLFSRLEGDERRSEDPFETAERKETKKHEARLAKKELSIKITRHASSESIVRRALAGTANGDNAGRLSTTPREAVVRE